MTIRVYFQTV